MTGACPVSSVLSCSTTAVQHCPATVPGFGVQGFEVWVFGQRFRVGSRGCRIQSFGAKGFSVKVLGKGSAGFTGHWGVEPLGERNPDRGFLRGCPYFVGVGCKGI